MEAQKKRLEDSMTNFMVDLDREYLRKFQGDMHRCAAKCCDNTTDSMEDVHRCVERCSNSLTQVQNYVQNEFSGIQSRLQRCVMDCHDSTKDKMGADVSERDVPKFTQVFESCAVKCIDKHFEILPHTFSRMRDTLKKQDKQQLNLM